MSAIRKPQRLGLTLLEVVLVVGMLGTITLLQAPAIQRARGEAAKKETENHIKQVALSMLTYHDTHKRFPLAWGPLPAKSADAPSGTLHYWLLPFLERDSVYKKAQPNTAGAHAKVWTLDKVYSQAIPAYVAPLDYSTEENTVKLSGETPWGVCNFAANTRVFGGLKATVTADAWDARARLATISDGMSNTIFFATRFAICGDPPGGSAWAGGNTRASLENFLKSGAFFGSDIEDSPLTAKGYTNALVVPFQVAPFPRDKRNPCDPLYAHSYTNKISVALGDGSVRTVSPAISLKTWGQACHPADGNILGPDW
jgi:type II secretory pathway pseudopilin PulG